MLSLAVLIVCQIVPILLEVFQCCSHHSGRVSQSKQGHLRLLTLLERTKLLWNTSRKIRAVHVKLWTKSFESKS